MYNAVLVKDILKLVNKSKESVFIEVYIDSKEVLVFNLYPGVIILKLDNIVDVYKEVLVNFKSLVNKSRDKLYFTNDLNQTYKQTVLVPDEILKTFKFEK